MNEGNMSKSNKNNLKGIFQPERKCAAGTLYRPGVGRSLLVY